MRLLKAHQPLKERRPVLKEDIYLGFTLRGRDERFIDTILNEWNNSLLPERTLVVGDSGIDE